MMRKRKPYDGEFYGNEPPPTIYDWVKNIFLPLALGLLSLGVITVVIAPEWVENTFNIGGEKVVTATPNEIEDAEEVEGPTPTVLVPTQGIVSRDTVTLEPSSTPSNAPRATSAPSPLREHFPDTIGTGIFANVTYSDGEAQLTDGELATHYIRFQRIRQEENPEGCGTSIFDTDKVWFSGSANTIFTVNGQEIGQLMRSTGKHGYVADAEIRVGDEICAVGYDAAGFQIVIGHDMYSHYDSYCYRGSC